jgi:exopolysaccharide production protein ExoZ
MKVPAATMTSRPDNGRLFGIEAARGIAALLVVAYHGGRHLREDIGYLPLAGIFNFGHAGVDFFFVLSGFIILFVHRDDLGVRARLGRYAWRRAARIYPLYWIASAATLIAVALEGKLSTLSFAFLGKSFLLWPQPVEPLLGVAWTLEFEILFYAVVGIAIVNLRCGIAVMLAWGIGIVAAAIWGTPSFPFGFILADYNLDFFLGMGAATLLRQRSIPRPSTVLFAGIVLFLACGAADNLELLSGIGKTAKLTYGVASMLLVIGLAELERQGRLDIPGALRELGASSYALYLIHFWVFTATLKTLYFIGLMDDLPGWSKLCAIIAAALVVALCLSRFVERPLLRICRKWSADYRDEAPKARASVAPQI